MRIVFFGTPVFAATNLSFLHEKGINIVSVVSAPDKQKGRGKKIIATDVKLKSNELNIEVKTPTSLKDESFILELRSLKEYSILGVGWTPAVSNGMPYYTLSY